MAWGDRQGFVAGSGHWKGTGRQGEGGTVRRRKVCPLVSIRPETALLVCSGRQVGASNLLAAPPLAPGL